MLGTVADLSFDRLTKTEQKAILKVIKISKKLKYIDDLILSKETQFITIQDNWLIKKKSTFKY